MNPVVESLPIVVLYPHSRCNCRCLMCDIWKNPTRAEISQAELRRHLDAFTRLGVKWAVLSGGEPLMHSDLFRFSALLRERGIRVTLLSTGLLFERHAVRIVDSIDDAIVSLDGPPPVHDRIRRVPGAFGMTARGIEAILRHRPDFPVSARSTVQRENHAYLRQTARATRDAGLRSVSFLAADVSSEAFNRSEAWSAARQSEVGLSEREIEVLEREIEALAGEWAGTGFVLESRDKLLRIARHFRAHLGLCEPVAPVCNAPWVSAVIEADGTVRPCFFHRAIGRINGSDFLQVLNGPEALAFRSSLDVSRNATCRRCVCSLHFAGSK